MGVRGSYSHNVLFLEAVLLMMTITQRLHYQVEKVSQHRNAQPRLTGTIRTAHAMVQSA